MPATDMLTPLTLTLPVPLAELARMVPVAVRLPALASRVALAVPFGADARTVPTERLVVELEAATPAVPPAPLELASSAPARLLPPKLLVRIEAALPLPVADAETLPPADWLMSPSREKR